MMTADEFIALWRDTSTTVECHTSGSTDAPKSIRLTKHDMAVSARATNRFFGLSEGSVFVCPMSFDFIGARMMAVRAELCGGKLVTPTPSNRFSFDGIADLLAIVPSQVDNIVDDPSTVARIRNVIIGGAPLDAQRRHRIVEAGIRTYTTYGMTETASHIALARVTDSTPVYQALDGVRLSTDNRDCLVIDMPDRDADHIVTNDIVRLTGPNTFEWEGRADNVINSGGIKIHPEIIEAIAAEVLNEAHIPFTALIVKPMPDPKWGTIAVLEVETTSILESDPESIHESAKDLETTSTLETTKGLDPKANLETAKDHESTSILESEIIERIAMRFDDRRKSPKRLITTPRLARTPSGKPLRH